jgi:hypothetical protein
LFKAPLADNPRAGSILSFRSMKRGSVIMRNGLPTRVALFLGLAVGLHAAAPAPVDGQSPKQGNEVVLAGMKPYLSPYYMYLN